MTFEEYFEQQKKIYRLTWGDVIYMLAKARSQYHFRPIPTFVPFGQIAWSDEEETKERLRAMHNRIIPFHFVYIKFYKNAAGEGPFALVGGKTNWRRPDLQFSYEITTTTDRGDRAKRYLLHTGGSWYCQEVLAVWTDKLLLTGKNDVDGIKIEEKDARGGPQVKAVKKIEADIQTLLGLFSS